jgi:exodeoxyribonuclease VII large subunit
MPPTSSPDEPDTRRIYTVSQLNREVGQLLKSGFPPLWLEGEISNLARPASGHLYFSVKDSSSQLRCAMFRRENSRLNFRPENGEAVLCRGRVGLYEPRGDYQFIVEHMEQAGEGRLRQAFERLKRRLAAEGLFDAATKQPLPRLPRRIGVITSPSGAALRDILNVLGRRFAAVPVRLYPVAVQGEDAADQIVAALALANERRDCDVLILARGGGSLEDLQAFNEERVARAVHGSALPVICGVGHEIDFSIADFAADLRAPTPSGAAELAVPDAAAWQRGYAELAERLARGLRRSLADRRTRCAWLDRRVRLLHPGHQLRQRAQRLDELEQRLRRAAGAFLERRGSRATGLAERLLRWDPRPRISDGRTRTLEASGRLQGATRRLLEAAGRRLESLERALRAVGPQSTLERGYAIVATPGGDIVRSAAAVAAGERLSVRVADGSFDATVAED